MTRKYTLTQKRLESDERSRQETVQRNLEIFCRREDGESYGSIAKDYINEKTGENLSRQRIHILCKRAKRYLLNDSDTLR